MTPLEAASVVRLGWTGGDFIAQRRLLAAGLVLAQEVDRLTAEAAHWERAAAVLPALKAELDRVGAQLDRVEARLGTRAMSTHVKLDLTHAEAAATFSIVAMVLNDPDWYDQYNGHERRALARVSGKIAGQLRLADVQQPGVIA